MNLKSRQLVKLKDLLDRRRKVRLKQELINPTGKSNPNYTHLHTCINDPEISGSVHEGSSRCFGGNELVVTSQGSKSLKDLVKGDMVLTYNEQSRSDEYKEVIKPLSFENTKPSYKIELKTGEIIECTEDHEYFYEGAWVSIKHIVSLWNDKKKD